MKQETLYAGGWTTGADSFKVGQWLSPIWGALCPWELTPWEPWQYTDRGYRLRTIDQIRSWPIGDIFEAAKEAGRQLVKEEMMSPEILDIVSRELMTREMYIQIINQMFQQFLDSLKND